MTRRLLYLPDQPHHTTAALSATEVYHSAAARAHQVADSADRDSIQNAKIAMLLVEVVYVDHAILDRFIFS